MRAGELPSICLSHRVYHACFPGVHDGCSSFKRIEVIWHRIDARTASVCVETSAFECKMRSFNIAYAPIQLIQGDFLQMTPSLRDALSSAGLLFLNNPKFEPFVNLSILQNLCPMLPKKAKVICFESIIGTKGYWNNCLL